jgi:alpha,alpha-trehalose phosphorylase
MTHNRDDNAWYYRESAFDQSGAAYKESLFAVGNGYLGVRGFFDEGYPEGTQNTSAATFLNGVYESLPIEYDESAYGFAKNCHRIVPVPRQYFRVEVNGTEFKFKPEQITGYQRELGFKTGNYQRTLIWNMPNGDQLQLDYERSASYSNESVVFSRLTIRPLNFDGSISVRSVLDSSNPSLNDVDDPRKGGTIPAENWLRQSEVHSIEGSSFHYRTRNSGIDVVAFMLTQRSSDHEVSTHHNAETTDHSVQFKSRQGEVYCIESAVSYVDSRKYSLDELVATAQSSAQEVLSLGYDEFLKQQAQHLEHFWQSADIEIDSDDGAQYATRFSLFHLFQSTGRDGISSIAAKGLTGAGYDGHYFWDSETYVFPFWLFSQPETAKQLLQYRVSTLASAKQRAREMGHERGALFAWRTIGGEECSSYFPAGTAQYHINADIAYACKSYYQATQDHDFLINGMAEVVLETARIWLDLGHLSSSGEFKIFSVTGPDEYTAVVNNNFYTNKMVQVHLRWACEIFQILNRNAGKEAERLLQNIGLTEEEVTSWQAAADAMYFPFDDEKQIYAQDDSFLDKPKWDFENTPAEKYPLLLHFHPLVIYRHQVLKQADTLLALLLAGDEIEPKIKRNCFNYYEPINTHDSTLSTCVHGVIANEIGEHEKAYQYYCTTMNLDLDDSHHNTYYGVHTAAMGGIWMGAIQGFGGLRYSSGGLEFKPKLPNAWRTLAFRMQFQGRKLSINISHEYAAFKLESGAPMEIVCQGESFVVHSDSPVRITLNTTEEKIHD